MIDHQRLHPPRGPFDFRGVLVMSLIVVIDYGMGNIRSVARALEMVCAGARVKISSDPEMVRSADRVVFPGQGAMADCLRELNARGLVEAVKESMESKPFLGICIGLQVLFDYSEENCGPCLQFIQGRVARFEKGLLKNGRKLKVPHMGWNQVKQMSPHKLWEGIPDNSWFYFVHSYYVAAQDRNLIFGVTDYSTHFDSAVGRQNVFGVQFHPEKSETLGLRFLSNFAKWDGTS